MSSNNVYRVRWQLAFNSEAIIEANSEEEAKEILDKWAYGRPHDELALHDPDAYINPIDVTLMDDDEIKEARDFGPILTKDDIDR